MFNCKQTRIAAAVAIAMGLSATAYAQDTASALRGVITSNTGSTLANAEVVITDTRTGASRTLTTNETGTFSARGLAVGGPYVITVTDPTTGATKEQEVYLTLGETANVNLMVESNVERIAVTGTSMLNNNYGGTGPASNFSLRDLEEAPAINRDIKDIVRIDPRIYIDETYGDGIQCGGANPRFNSLTVDGVRMNDNFGLNSNGYPTERMPFAYDAIEQVAVELAPFDVKYGGFTACNINAVTKSGQNEFHGSVFFDYTNQDMRGDKIEDTKLEQGDFNEKRYGFSVGGPILEDQLFFFAAYEKYEGAVKFDNGAGDDPTAGNPIYGVSQAQVDEIAQIAREVYGYEVGDPIASAPVEDEKLLLKLDWQINDAHRAAFTYNWNDGGNIRQSDSWAYEFSNHYYDRGTELTSYVGEFYSNWTDNFSTEVRAGYQKVDNRQVTLGPKDFGEVQIETRFDHDNDGIEDSATVFLGADDSRQANKLYYDTRYIKLAGNYFMGDHVITAGFEREELDVYNLFVQQSRGGEYRIFIPDGSTDPNAAIDLFRQGIVDRIYYGSAAGTNNPEDAAGAFQYEINTLYVQDEYYMYEQDLTLTYGLRYDWYTSDDLPRENQNFIDLYGYSNATNFDGEGLLQPRVGFNWKPSLELEVRGGFGLYSGGNPNVWIANNYQNDGITQIQLQERGVDLNAVDLSGSGRPFYDVPQSMYDAVANASGNSPVNSFDPNFEIPSEWKYALGATYTFENQMVLMGDILYTKRKDSAAIIDLAFEQVGVASDGRPVYSNPNGREGDYQLTNADDAGSQLNLSLALSHAYDFGLDWSVAYAYTDSEEAQAMSSSVAGSNFSQTATSDMNNYVSGPANYEIPHRFTLRVNYGVEFFDGLETRFSLFGQANKGRPYSFGLNGRDLFGDTGNRQLLYVPTGADDSKVIFGPDFDTDAFFAYIQESGLDKYAGGIAPRNSFYSSWWNKFDLKVTQELPGFADGHKANMFFVIENVGNLLNSDWGVLYQAGFPQIEQIVDASLDDEYNVIYEQFNQPSPQSRETGPSLWEMRLGINYKF
ncbi:Carboxypeptidase regulatory-like domain-containing protein [Pseudidiomarina maritima]|uniref:Carboxypeptidase regulatory-like domain-containing protein n=1 Tax=Pseudidiomarina maritima TaxID=519453 RepID=A0A1I6HUR7_9GAMM|nr:TonB-dependent receptor [Pseudidiomarina maritima]SFR58181.1 Carboxypeptidase regulatory-like domain-containing protein [Pseudidiomarina maritima]